jgi:hypothetical protein
MIRALVLLLVATAATTATTATAGELQDGLQARRGRLLERLGPEAMAVLWSAAPKVYSRDVDYEFRHDSDLEHLTGIDQVAPTFVFANRVRESYRSPAPPTRQG